MSTLFKQRNRWYIAVNFNGKRVRRSLGTKNHDIAKQLQKPTEKKILRDLIVGKVIKPRNITFKELTEKFINTDHGYRKSTVRWYRQKIATYLKNGLPENMAHRDMVVRAVNRIYNWARKEGLTTSEKKLERVPSRYLRRSRVLTNDELNAVFDTATPDDFNRFVKFAYYTGARCGEIRKLRPEQIKIDSILVNGKTGKRSIRLNSQAQAILMEQEQLWHYTAGYVVLQWRRVRERIGVPDIRFHDIRRTFGYNLMIGGMSIYMVSKLLGHQSVKTTEQHYAPLLVSDIPDFEL